MASLLLSTREAVAEETPARRVAQFEAAVPDRQPRRIALRLPLDDPARLQRHADRTAAALPGPAVALAPRAVRAPPRPFTRPPPAHHQVTGAAQLDGQSRAF